MTLAALAQTIRHLGPMERMKLFDKLHPSIEDYLLAKIAHDRFKKTSRAAASWEELKS